MSELPNHVHVYDQRGEDRVPSHAAGLVYEEVTTKNTCLCGEVQPRRGGKLRVPNRRFLRTHAAFQVPLPALARVVAQTILSAEKGQVLWEPRERQLRSSYTTSQLRPVLLGLVQRGFVELEEKDGPQWVVYRIHIKDVPGLMDVAQPGRRALVEATRQRLLLLPDDTAGKAELLGRLDGVGRRLDDDAIAWALRVVEHGAAERTSLVRQFSARYDASKEFGAVRASVEGALGPLDKYGIYDPEARLLMHGQARLIWPEGDLSLRPDLAGVGISRTALARLHDLETQQVFLVENREILEAIVAGHVPLPEGALVVETSGAVGATIRHLVSITKCPVWIWADLDAAGIRIAQAILDAAGDRGRTLHMEASWLARATNNIKGEPLEDAKRLAAAPGSLGDLAREIVRTGKWMEQEQQRQWITGLQPAS